MVAWVARSAGLSATEPVRAADVVDAFDLARVPAEPVIFGERQMAELGCR